MKSNLSVQQSADTVEFEAPAPAGREGDSTPSGRVPPHSLDSEQALLGAIMLDNE